LSRDEMRGDPKSPNRVLSKI